MIREWQSGELLTDQEAEVYFDQGGTPERYSPSAGWTAHTRRFLSLCLACPSRFRGWVWRVPPEAKP